MHMIHSSLLIISILFVGIFSLPTPTWAANTTSEKSKFLDFHSEHPPHDHPNHDSGKILKDGANNSRKRIKK